MPNVRVFPCPRCGEFVATDTSRCRFCSAPIDPQTAQLAADSQAKENVRYMRRRYLRHMFIGGGIFILGLVISIGTFALAFSSPTGGYYVVTLGLVLYGASDFVYGLAGVLGMIR